MKNYRQVAKIIAENKNVRGVSPFVLGPVLVETQGDTNRPRCRMHRCCAGVDPETEGNVSELPKEIIVGNI